MGSKGDDAELKDILSLLNTNMPFVPGSVFQEHSSDRRFQLFEAISTVIVSRLQGGFEWEVTPVQGDNGVDFLGKKTLFSVQHPPVDANLLIGGQCKIRSDRNAFWKSVASDILNMIRHNKQICYIVIVYASPDSKEDIEAEAVALEGEIRRPICVFGLDEIRQFGRQHLEALRPIINGAALDDAASQRLFAFFIEDTVAPPIKFSACDVPERARTGIPFDIHLSVTTARADSDQIRLRWLAESATHCVSPVDLLTPREAVDPPGLPLGYSDTFSWSIPLRMIGYATGIQSLGRVELWSQGEMVAALDLGTLDFADTFHPVFYWPPNKAAQEAFDAQWSLVRTGCVRSLAVVGRGGSGKTRLCQELLLRAEQHGGNSISLSHPNGVEQPYRVFGDLLARLLPPGSSGIDPKQEVTDHLISLNPILAEQGKPTLAALFFSGSKEQLSSLDGNEVVKIVLLFILAGLRRRPVAIHLCDLHWAAPDVLAIFGEIIQRLDSTIPPSLARNGAMFLFEGRTGEIFRIGKGQQQTDWSCAAYEAFSHQHCQETLSLGLLDEQDSRGFVSSLFEHSQAQHRRVPDHLIPHQERLISEVMRYARGNPQHVVEQVKLLRQKGVIQRNPRTGLLYLADQLADVYAPPEDVSLLIRNRFQYCAAIAPDAMRLVRLLGLVQDRVDRQLFGMLRDAVGAGLSDVDVEATDFVIVPTSRAEEVVFRHENYYRVIREVEPTAKDRDIGVDCYLRWLDRTGKQGAQAEFIRALALSEASMPDWGAVSTHLKRALTKAEREQEIQLALQVCQVLIGMPPEILSPAMPQRADEKYEMTMRLATHMSAVGDRAQAAQRLETLVAEMEAEAFGPPGPPHTKGRHFARINAEVKWANSELNLNRPDRSIRILERVLPKLRALAAVHESTTDADWRLLEVEAVNRLAIGHAILGNHDLALRLASEAATLARAAGDAVLEGNVTVDLGIITQNENPAQAVTIIKRGNNLLAEAKDQERYLAETSLLEAQMVLAAQDGRDGADFFASCFSRLSELYALARTGGFIQEAGAAALLAGVCRAAQEEGDAEQWLMECIAVCYRGNSRETLWRAHIDLAQFCLGRPGAGGEAAAHHADHALRLMRSSLDGQDINSLAARARVLRLPMAQVLRIWRTIGDVRAIELVREFPDLERFFAPAGSHNICIPADGSWQVAVICRGDNSYVLY